MSSPFTTDLFAHNVARRTLACAIFMAALNTFSNSAFATQVPLTLGHAQQLAVERSRQVDAKEFAATASEEMAVAARQLPDPMLRAGIENLPVNGPERFSMTSDFMTMRNIGVMQQITRSDKRQARADQHLRQAEKSVAEKAATIAEIQRDTALAWLDRFYAEAMSAVITENAVQSKLEIEAAEGAYRAGRGNQSDIFAARSALSTYHDRASEIERRIRNAKAILARWVGNAADQPLAGMPALDTIRLDAQALDTELTHHPRIAVLAKEEEVAAAAARLAQANKKADWSVELMYSQRGPSYSNMVSFGVSVPLQWNQRNLQDRELAAKLAMVEQAKAEKEDILRAHVAETRAMVNEWENGRERYARYEQELIPLAKERTLAAMAAYRGGKANLADVLMARRNEIDVRLEALQLQAETARLWAELNFLFPDDGLTRHVSATTNKGFK